MSELLEKLGQVYKNKYNNLICIMMRQTEAIKIIKPIFHLNWTIFFQHILFSLDLRFCSRTYCAYVFENNVLTQKMEIWI